MLDFGYARRQLGFAVAAQTASQRANALCRLSDALDHLEHQASFLVEAEETELEQVAFDFGTAV